MKVTPSRKRAGANTARLCLNKADLHTIKQSCIEFEKPCSSVLLFPNLQKNQFWSSEPLGSMAPTGTRCTTWRRRTGCWSTPRTRRGVWPASACSPKKVCLITRPTLGRGSPSTWWRSSGTCTMRWGAARHAQIQQLWRGIHEGMRDAQKISASQNNKQEVYRQSYEP